MVLTTLYIYFNSRMSRRKILLSRDTSGWVVTPFRVEGDRLKARLYFPLEGSRIQATSCSAQYTNTITKFAHLQVSILFIIFLAAFIFIAYDKIFLLNNFLRLLNYRTRDKASKMLLIYTL